ncbi:MAG: hypothetical protein CMJ72_15670 [Planctomycetaceae bacterium]|nr:hypothetical protein [Planctomycetaceae bacterium]HCK42765.1 hypothetical protein [Planctomycetaceae bacterium]
MTEQPNHFFREIQHMVQLEQILKAPIVPTVFPTDPDALCALANVLAEEDYPILELLGRPMDKAIEILHEINKRPERNIITWALGTVRSKTEAKAAVEVRPDLLVSPAFSRQVLDVAVAADIPYIPGVETFQDVQNVCDAFEEHHKDVEVLKLCPVYHLSAEYVGALCGCFPGIVYCPTGEITLENYLHWKSISGIVAPMGGQLVPHDWILRKEIHAIRNRLREFRQLAQDAAASS